MEKFKNVIKKVYAWLGLAYQWLSLEGGMLHILAFISMMLAFEPFMGYKWASIVSWAIGVGKEVVDYIRKSNNLRQCANDIVRDAIGWSVGSLVILMQSIV